MKDPNVSALRGHRRKSFRFDEPENDEMKDVTCTGVSASARPPCSGNIYGEKPAGQLRYGEEGRRSPFVPSHQLAVLVVGQDPRDVPVPRRDGLQRVRARVRLRAEK